MPIGAGGRSAAEKSQFQIGRVRLDGFFVGRLQGRGNRHGVQKWWRGGGLIVLVRTFLSFSLEIELDGIVPWRRWTQRERTW